MRYGTIGADEHWCSMSVVVPKSAIFAVTSQEDVDALYGKTKPPKDTDSARALRLSRTGSADPPPPVVVALKCGDREKTIVIHVAGLEQRSRYLQAYGAPSRKSATATRSRAS